MYLRYHLTLKTITSRMKIKQNTRFFRHDRVYFLGDLPEIV